MTTHTRQQTTISLHTRQLKTINNTHETNQNTTCTKGTNAQKAKNTKQIISFFRTAHTLPANTALTYRFYSHEFCRHKAQLVVYNFLPVTMNINYTYPKISNHFHLEPKLKMNGAIPLLPLYTFIVSVGTVLLPHLRIRLIFIFTFTLKFHGSNMRTNLYSTMRNGTLDKTYCPLERKPQGTSEIR